MSALENDGLRAEVAEYQRSNNCLKAEIDRLRAENAEIRKAMQEIYDKPQLAAVISSAILAKMTKEGE